MRIQRISILFISLTMIFACAEKRNEFIVTGHVIDHNQNSTLIFSKRILPSNKFLDIDSVTVDKTGNFILDFNSIEPGYYRIKYKDSQGSNSKLVLWSQKMKKIDIKIDTISYGSGKSQFKSRKINIKGSDDNDRLEGYFAISKNYFVDSIAPTRKSLNELFKDASTTQTETIDSLNSKLKYYKEERIEKLNKYVLDSMDTSMAIFQTISQWDDTDSKFMDKVLNRFKEKNSSAFILPFIESEINKLKEKSIIGKLVENFKLSNSNGELINSDMFIGKKLVFIDFWASWCKPCIEEIPAYKKLYSTHSKENFEFISISTDKNTDKWLAVSKKYNIPWINLTDNDNENISEWFKISLIPTNYLVDVDGKIIRKNITVQDLESFLEKKS